MFAADSGGGSGGGSGGATLKDQLAAAEKNRDEFKTRAETAEGSLKSEQEAHGKTKTALTAAETSFKSEQEAHAATKLSLEAEQKAHKELQAKDTTATGKAAEALAKNGIAPATKDTPKNLAEAKDGAAVYDQYKRLKGKARAKFFAEHQKTLMAFAADEEKRLLKDGDEFGEDQDPD